MNQSEVILALAARHGDLFTESHDARGVVTLEVTKEILKEVLSFIKREGYEVLCDLTGVDYLAPTKRTKVVYWLQNRIDYQRIRVVLYVGREGSIPSVIDLWAGADWYERELFDLFGVRFEGHPGLKRILMPDDWQGHPLLRDFALTEEPVEFKHGVKPKIPSELIPYVEDNRRI
jgi:NADH-quinone oxidoreductase subunit C